MNEIEKIKLRYETRKTNGLVIKNSSKTMFSEYITIEREKVYFDIINSNFKDIESIVLLEIGAGEGSNIPFFNQIGIPFSNIYANELLEDRAIKLRENFPKVHHLPGNALDIKRANIFDIVFQSTVFTSILDDSLKKEIAYKMYDLTKIDGIIIWYDFAFNNPNNKDVKGVKKKEIINSFPIAKKFEFYKATLAPPIGRRVGRLYNFFNKFKFLRTHIIAVIHK